MKRLLTTTAAAIAAIAILAAPAVASTCSTPQATAEKMAAGFARIDVPPSNSVGSPGWTYRGAPSYESWETELLNEGAYYNGSSAVVPVPPAPAARSELIHLTEEQCGAQAVNWTEYPSVPHSWRTLATMLYGFTNVIYPGLIALGDVSVGIDVPSDSDRFAVTPAFPYTASLQSGWWKARGVTIVAK